MSGLNSLFRSSVIVAVAIAVVVVAVLLLLPGQNGLVALLALFSDGLVAVLMLTSATTAGLNILHLSLGGLAGRVHRLTYFLIAAALGMGFLSLASLGLGVLGLLSRGIFVVLLFLPVPTGLLIFQRLSLNPGPPFPQDHPDRSSAGNAGYRGRWLWLLAGLALGLGILAADLPPGVLWLGESRGRQALERHLLGPKEYLAAGRISFLPHDVHASLPANMEMLYLLAMGLKSGPSSDPMPTELLAGPHISRPYNAVYLINFLNLGIGVLAVLALYCAAGYLYAHRTGSGLIFACCPWLLMVATMAYVETVVLLYTILAVLVVLGGRRMGLSAVGSAILAGVFAGLACGSKFSAILLVLLPLLAVLVVQRLSSRGRTLRDVAIYLVAGAVVFCPWLIKNLAFTGNPFFPWFYDQFGGAGLTADLARRWSVAEGFRLFRGLSAGWLGELWRQFLAQPKFGPAVILLSFAALLLAWGRRNTHRLSVDLPLAVLFACQLLVWTCFTNMDSGLFIVALVPLCLLAGRAVALMLAGRARPWSLAAMLSLACVAGPVWSGCKFLESTTTYAPVGMQDRVGLFIGQSSPGPPHLAYVNSVLPAGSRILMVGDSVSFYWTHPVTYNTPFNVNPLAQQVAAGNSPHQIIEWLVANDYTHLYVDFYEIDRRAARFGYQPRITPRLLDRLSSAGLVELKRFEPHGSSGGLLPAILYRVVPP